MHSYHHHFLYGLMTIFKWKYVLSLCVYEYTIYIFMYIHATLKTKKQKLQSYFVYMSANCLRYLHILLPVFGVCRSRWLWWRWWSWQERNCIYRTGKKCTIYYTLCKIFDAIIRIQIFFFFVIVVIVVTWHSAGSSTPNGLCMLLYFLCLWL